MKTLFQWASRHAPLAIALIILFDVTNALNGFVLGATLLDNVPTAGLLAGVTVLVGWAVAVRWLYYTSAGDYWFRRRCLFGAFLGNFLLFGLVAGLMTPSRTTYWPARGGVGSLRAGPIRSSGPTPCGQSGS